MILSSIGQPIVVAGTLGAAFLNYLLFFWDEIRGHMLVLKSEGSRFSGAPARLKEEEISNESLHCCEECSRTELSHPDLEFRVASSGVEYCREHLPKSPRG
jgi:hypothetical protein